MKGRGVFLPEGLVRRYALDVKPYTASEFLQHYGEGPELLEAEFRDT